MDKIILLKKRSLKARSLSELLNKLSSIKDPDIPEGYSDCMKLLIEDLKIKKSMGVSLETYSNYISKPFATLLSLLGFTKYIRFIDLSAPRRDLLQIIINNNSALDLVKKYYSDHDKVLTSYDHLSIVLSSPNEYLINRLNLSSHQLAIVALVTRKYDLINWSQVSRVDKLKLSIEADDFTEYTNQLKWDDKFGFIYFSFFMRKHILRFLVNHTRIMIEKFINKFTRYELLFK